MLWFKKPPATAIRNKKKKKAGFRFLIPSANRVEKASDGYLRKLSASRRRRTSICPNSVDSSINFIDLEGHKKKGKRLIDLFVILWTWSSDHGGGRREGEGEGAACAGSCRACSTLPPWVLQREWGVSIYIYLCLGSAHIDCGISWI